MHHRFEVRASFVEILGHGVVWILLTVVTLGIAGLLWPYYLVQFVVSRTVVMDEKRHLWGNLVVESSFVAYVGHALLWLLAILLTIGIATPFWLYDVYRFVLQHTRIERTPKGLPGTV